RQYLVDRYGEFVLLQPVLAWHTLLLWGAAPAIIIVGGVVLFVAGRRRRLPAAGPLTADEQRVLDDLGEPPSA
ncbi:MAG: cytochrome c-type biogenesis protein CcmH, partial [Devosia sp.]